MWAWTYLGTSSLLCWSFLPPQTIKGRGLRFESSQVYVKMVSAAPWMRDGPYIIIENSRQAMLDINLFSSLRGAYMAGDGANRVSSINIVTSLSATNGGFYFTTKRYWTYSWSGDHRKSFVKGGIFSDLLKVLLLVEDESLRVASRSALQEFTSHSNN